ncbi:LapD/MoxY N-terminal periplasmic domain-containing protein [Alteromonas sp. 1_MG-2023]|uniref:bifunctional diguanylate cyclase/phosphodiesterase n=1 Tax=Alteromonas sp. 1_MG-2023 TaxID=3062669 RepID=UPI0026E33B91|nr:LapD/MoxY N-terminal periplasmic domain-containing protein [Alteromonas sp. 1_MG-2023]MDO6568478.1 LapD/MoxY N-terminal periplasmic domain-containing protein [Alteromonas sp. 1_MG-2023]
MSITRELWLAIIAVVLVAIVGSVSIHGATTKRYVEEQLYSKNIDNANMLALTLSSLEKDTDTLDLFIMSQFDVGHYASIMLQKPNGEIVSSHTHTVQLDEKTPVWFASLFSPDVAPGIAQVTEGWGQFGVVTVETDTTFAVASMWKATLRLILGLSLVGTVAGLIGAWFLRMIMRPLDQVVEQAESFSQMQFIQVKEPRTLELKRVVRAMNFLASNSQRIMDDENTRLDILRHKTQFDDESGLANRDYFISILKGQLAFRDTEGVNCIFLLRVVGGKEAFLRNGPEGRRKRLIQFTDSINECLAMHHHHYTDCRVARMQKNEIGILLTETHDIVSLAEAIHGACLAELSEQGDPKLFQSVVRLRPDDNVASTLMRLDTMLDDAIDRKMSEPYIEGTLDNPISLVEENRWKKVLTEGITNQAVETFNFPVLDSNRQLVHYQSWAGIEIDNDLRKSGYYTHWARYLGLLPSLELATISHLFSYIKKSGTNATFAFLCSEQFILNQEILAQLYFQIKMNEDVASQLNFEVRESTAARFPREFELFCTTLKAKGCGIGLKRVGESFSQLMNVQELGLDYVVIDSAFMADINYNPANHAFIRGFCSLAHTFGIRVYADGVKGNSTQNLFVELGIDGVVSNIEVIEHLLND